MCCFSRPVPFVASTKIFARPTERGTQMLAYQMLFAAAGDVAMILPLPVPPGSPEDAVRFIDLSGLPRLFAELDKGFPTEMSALARGGARSLGLEPQSVLVVHDVGEFEASFVPTIADFDRLDERFRLPAGVWDALPRYADYGFAVFKLRDDRSLLRRLFGRRARRKEVHPMAFEMPVREPGRAFFPTVHVHDGEVHPEAPFDHSLYVQGVATPDVADGWIRSSSPASGFMAVERTEGLVRGDEHCFRCSRVGVFDNEDVWL